MASQKLLDLVFQDNDFKKIIRNIENRIKSQLIYGIDKSQKHLLMSAVKAFTGRPVLILTTDLSRAEKIYEDLINFSPADKLLLFPARENIFYETLTVSKEITEQRMMVLEKVVKEKDFTVIAPAAALFPLIPPKENWENASLKIRVNENVKLDILVNHLAEAGYKRNSLVDGRGQFSVRGGILDVFPVVRDNPVRVEFFGDEIESIREFDPANQRSKTRLEEADLSPAHEIILDRGAFQRGKVEVEKDLEERVSFLKRAREKKTADKLFQKVQSHLEKINERIYFNGIEQYLPYFYTRPQTFLDYLPEDTLIFIDEPVHFLENSEKLWKEIEETNNSLLGEGSLIPRQAEVYRPVKEFVFNSSYQYISFSLLMRKVPLFSPQDIIIFNNKTMPTFYGKWEVLKEEIRHWFKEGYKVCIMTSSPERAGEIAASCETENIAAVYTELLDELPPKTVGVILCNLENGFILPKLKIALLTEQEIIYKSKKKKFWKTSREGIRISDYHDLEVGDYVVHEHHGIGQYLGVRTLEINTLNKDYLYLKYGGEDKLFIPTDQIGLIKKYIGVEGKRPRLHGLGSSEWARVKSRVKDSVQKLARELLSLYAVRKSVEGYAYSSDQIWQREFEARFPYEETPDQFRAIQEVKKDMEKNKPMDRLLCGDVGYGKTEVALRAAFKAVLDGKQAAFLVPTTILAMQHYQNFKERFAGFPVNIEVLSRFKKPSEQKEIVKQVKTGWVDIIIGTHRLLSSDVRFKDLGLLIIDEEQRFGVRHKEKLKVIRKNVDVMAMTATPIPRTLHMSLVGVRDLSVIETPPENRYPIQTYVVEYSDQVIKEAILRELNRGGQVYFVYNRVETIEKWGEHLKKMVPEARIAIGHGQMPESTLEKVMCVFLNGGYDILLSTTIVEAGLDIPNVNTMIIYDADKMGLSQLYQLRGRVGRSNRLAYAYLAYQKDKVLSEVAEKRLQAIKEFTELGSGFKIALRDLEIRGAGNILGSEQHGFMMAVGFDLYCQLLEQSIRELKGVRKIEISECKIEINVDAYIPTSYIQHHSQKISIYQKIAAIQSLEEADDLVKELNDRYGQLLTPVENLISVARLKVYARILQITSIVQEKDLVFFKFTPELKVKSEEMLRFAKSFSGDVSLSVGKQISLKVRVKGMREGSLLDRLES
ncbi:MAG: transcription-repair coupling factor, partial [Firmicutes bacterium HGW-Firmicutes-13]